MAVAFTTRSLYDGTGPACLRSSIRRSYAATRFRCSLWGYGRRRVACDAVDVRTHDAAAGPGAVYARERDAQLRGETARHRGRARTVAPRWRGRRLGGGRPGLGRLGRGRLGRDGLG